MEKIIWTNSTDEKEIRALVDKRGRPHVVSYSEASWPLKPNQSGYPGTHICCGQLVAISETGKPCHALTVWREKHKFGTRLYSTGYYCEKHLPSELRPKE